jgi:hypothetical protein
MGLLYHFERGRHFWVCGLELVVDTYCMHAFYDQRFGGYGVGISWDLSKRVGWNGIACTMLAGSSMSVVELRRIGVVTSCLL